MTSETRNISVSIDAASAIEHVAEHREMIELAKQEGRNEAFAAMMKHADAVILGTEDNPRSIYDLFMKSIQAAAAGELPKRPSLSFSERREIAKEFVSKHGANLFD